MDVKAEWYEAIATRMSRRRFDGRPVPEEVREQLEVFCDGASAPAGEPGSDVVRPGQIAAPARVCIIDDAAQQLFTGLVGSYGKVSGATLAAAFVGRAVAGRRAQEGEAAGGGAAGGEPAGGGSAEGEPAGREVPEDGQAAVGYLGEALILEATRLGLDTCWIAGSFDAEAAGRLLDLAHDEHVVALTPLGYAVRQQAGGERLLRTLVKASARLSVEKLAPGILDGGWPQWAVSAVQAARLAPSGANRQPWRFRFADGALVLGRAEKLYWTAPIDLGIARLHVELGARHEGVAGAWMRLSAPDVAAYAPD